MKAILQFDLNNPEDAYDHKVALNGSNYKLVIAGTCDYIRGMLKYEQLTDEQIHTLEAVRRKINDLIAEYDLQFND